MSQEARSRILQQVYAAKNKEELEQAFAALPYEDPAILHRVYVFEVIV